MSNKVPKNKILTNRPPYYLKSYAAAMWRRIVPLLQGQYDFKKIDQTQIEMFCIQYEILRKAYDSIEDDGVVNRIEKSVQDASGKIVDKDLTGFKQNDAVKVITNAVTQLNKLSDNLGLTPASRSSLMSLGSDEEDDDDVSQSLAEVFNLTTPDIKEHAK